MKALKKLHISRLVRSKKFQIPVVALVCIAIGASAAGLAIHASSVKNNGLNNPPTNTGSSSSIPPTNAPQVNNTSGQSQTPTTPVPTGSQSTKPVSKPFVPYTCTYTTIPRQYLTEYVAWLGAGAAFNVPGQDGSTKSCTADSNGYKPADVTVQPINWIGYIGTGTISSSGLSQAQIDAAHQQRINDCVAYVQIRAPGSSAYQQCYSIP